MEQEKSVNEWIGALTHKGYDIVDSSCYTSRHKKGEEHWNTNFPMVHTIFHLRKDKSDIILSSYATNSTFWHTYAIALTGKAKNRLHGFDVIGTREKEIPNFEELTKFLEPLESTWS